jgi:hypothetical protein
MITAPLCVWIGIAKASLCADTKKIKLFLLAPTLRGLARARRQANKEATTLYIASFLHTD